MFPFQKLSFFQNIDCLQSVKSSSEQRKNDSYQMPQPIRQQSIDIWNKIMIQNQSSKQIESNLKQKPFDQISQIPTRLQNFNKISQNSNKSPNLQINDKIQQFSKSSQCKSHRGDSQQQVIDVLQRIQFQDYENQNQSPLLLGINQLKHSQDFQKSVVLGKKDHISVLFQQQMIDSQRQKMNQQKSLERLEEPYATRSQPISNIDHSFEHMTKGGTNKQNYMNNNVKVLKNQHENKAENERKIMSQQKVRLVSSDKTPQTQQKQITYYHDMYTKHQNQYVSPFFNEIIDNKQRQNHELQTLPLNPQYVNSQNNSLPLSSPQPSQQKNRVKHFQSFSKNNGNDQDLLKQINKMGYDFQFLQKSFFSDNQNGNQQFFEQKNHFIEQYKLHQIQKQESNLKTPFFQNIEGGSNGNNRDVLLELLSKQEEKEIEEKEEENCVDRSINEKVLDNRAIQNDLKAIQNKKNDQSNNVIKLSKLQIYPSVHMFVMPNVPQFIETIHKIESGIEENNEENNKNMFIQWQNRDVEFQEKSQQNHQNREKNVNTKVKKQDQRVPPSQLFQKDGKTNLDSLQQNVQQTFIKKLQQQSQHFQSLIKQMKQQIHTLQVQRTKLTDQLYQVHKQLSDIKMIQMPKKEEFKSLEDENEKLNKQIQELLDKIGQAEEQMEVFMIKYGRIIEEYEKGKNKDEQKENDKEGQYQNFNSVEKMVYKNNKNRQQNFKQNQRSQQQGIQKDQQQSSNSNPTQQKQTSIQQLKSILLLKDLQLQKVTLQYNQAYIQIRRCQQRIKQLQIGAEHDWQEWNLKERAMENQIKILKYHMNQLLEKKAQNSYGNYGTSAYEGIGLKRNNERMNQNNKNIHQIQQNQFQRKIYKHRQNSYLNPQQQVGQTKALRKKHDQALMLSPKVQRIKRKYEYKKQVQRHKEIQNSLQKIKQKSRSNERNRMKINELKRDIDKIKKEIGNNFALSKEKKQVQLNQNYARGYGEYNNRYQNNHYNYAQKKDEQKINQYARPISPPSNYIEGIYNKNIAMNQVNQKLQKLRQEVRKQLVRDGMR